MEKSKVAVIRCSDYRVERVEQALQKGFELLEINCGLFKPGEKILLKPNLLAAVAPEMAVTTHPAVFRAAAKTLLEMGLELTYGDSPALGSPEKAAVKAGLAEIAKELDIKLADFSTPEQLICPEASQNKVFTIARGVKECDGLVSIAKLKTHGLMKITTAVKNQFGCIPGLLKGEFHLKLPNPQDFARMLVDLNLALRPRLYLVDGIVVMEGNGPRNGTPRHLGLLLMSTDPVALDSTICRIPGLDPEYIPTVIMGREAGLGRSARHEIEVLGDGEGLPPLTDFQTVGGSRDFAPQAEWMRQRLVPRPVINDKKCVSCGICIKMCPLSSPAVGWRTEDRINSPVYDYKRCIRCYCCQELCPEGAITLNTPWAGKILNRMRPRDKGGKR